MSRLSDADILFFHSTGALGITPWNDDCLQAASYDLHLAPYARTPHYYSHRNYNGTIVQPIITWEYEKFDEPDLAYTLAPNGFGLFSTIEKVRVGANLAAAVAGKSSRAREGLAVEFAGWVDPGFEGQITLEIKNNLPFPIKMTAGMPICQIIFEELRTRALRPYGERGHYQLQEGPTASWTTTTF